MWKCTITNPASFAAVSAADMRDFIRTSDTTQDTLLTQLLDAASDKWTAETGHVLCSTDFALRLDAFPSVYYDRDDQPSPFANLWYWNPNSAAPSLTIFLPRHPVTAVSSVQYLDTDGAWQTLSGCTYDTVSTPARVILPSNLPTLHPTQKPTVKVNFTAGYASAGTIPSVALVGIKLLAAHWYNNGTGEGGAYTTDDYKELPQGWSALSSRFDMRLIGDWNR